jgi:AcrR family transcriptional regulator
MPAAGFLRARKTAATRAAVAREALRLFAEHGFEGVTVADVAAAAGVGERTVFRCFPDQEELLFGEDEACRSALAAALAARPAAEPPVAALTAASAAVTAALADRRDELAARLAVIRSSRALEVRKHARHAGFEAVLAAGLRARPPRSRRAAARSRGVACYDEAVDAWLHDADPHDPGLAARHRDALATVGRLLAPSE